jgi:GMP synthase (glutamine-hydrolysing)
MPCFEGLGDVLQAQLTFDKVWISHDDQLSVMPPDFHVMSTVLYAAIAHNSKSFLGIQFHPEVTHSPQGRQRIGRFVLNICQCRQNWTMVKQSPYHVIIMLTAIAGGIYWH